MNVVELQKKLESFSPAFLKGLKYTSCTLFIECTKNGNVEYRVLYQGFMDPDIEESTNIWFEDSTPQRLISRIIIAIAGDDIQHPISV